MHFDADAADLDLVLDNVSIHIKRRYNRRAFAKSNFVALYLWSGGNALYKNTGRLATHDDVFGENDVVFWLCINHDRPGIKMRKRALMNRSIALKRQDACRERVLQCVTLKVAVENFKTCIGLRNDAGYFSVGFASAAIEGEDAIVHFEDARFYHDDRVHVLFNVELPNNIGTTIHIILHILLIRLHVQLLVRTGQYHLQIIDGTSFFWSNVNYEARLDLLPDRDIQ